MPNLYRTTADLEREIGPLTQYGGGLIGGSGRQFRITGQGYEEITPAGATPTPTPAVPEPRSPRDIYEGEAASYFRASEERATSERESRRLLQQQELERELSSIESETQRAIREKQIEGEKELAKTRGINIRAGLPGSPFAEALKSEVKGITERGIETERERSKQLKERAKGISAESLQKIEENYYARMDELERGRLGLMKEKVEYAETQQKEALGDFDMMAKSGQVDIEKLRSNGLLEGYASQTGKSAQELEMRFNNLLPTAEQSHFKWQDGKALQWNPKIGDFVRRPDLDSKEGGTFKLQQFGDYMLKLPLDDFGNVDLDPTKPMSDYIWGVKPEDQKKTDLLTLDEKKKLYPDLPYSLINRPEQEVLEELGSPWIPKWYQEMVRQNLGLEASVAVSQEEWDKFRNEILKEMRTQVQKQTPAGTSPDIPVQWQTEEGD